MCIRDSPSRNGLDVNTFGAGSSSLPASDYSSRLTPTGLIHLDKYRSDRVKIANGSQVLTGTAFADARQQDLVGLVHPDFLSQGQTLLLFIDVTADQPQVAASALLC